MFLVPLIILVICFLTTFVLLPLSVIISPIVLIRLLDRP
jgi:hypothetical protein